MPDNRASAEVHLDPSAREFVRRRGGEIYVWTDGAGLSRHAMSEPDAVDDWTTIDEGDVRFHIADSTADATHWYVRLMRFPWRRLDVTSNLRGRGQIETGTMQIYAFRHQC